MTPKISYCGLNCATCPSFIATQNNDNALRKKTASFYSDLFRLDYTAEDINCDGCLSESGRLIHYCKACKIRNCCREKNLNNCGACPDYPCNQLKKFQALAASTKRSYQAFLNGIMSG